jgi:Polyketide cyclase / dehydrase and lipid transport
MKWLGVGPAIEIESSANHQRNSLPMTTNYMACPTDTVEAPVGVVWKLLTDISGWGSFFDIHVISVEPPGPAAKGQRMRGEKGPRWLRLGGSFEYTLIDETHYKLELDVRLSLGLWVVMTVHEAMDCVPLGDGRCRVNYHCNFGFPGGWRGRLLRILLSRGLKEGPADSLSRLKRAAEQEHRDRTAEK